MSIFLFLDTAHFLVALALFSLSTINFITGLCICMQSSRSVSFHLLVPPFSIPKLCFFIIHNPAKFISLLNIS